MMYCIVHIEAIFAQAVHMLQVMSGDLPALSVQGTLRAITCNVCGDKALLKSKGCNTKYWCYVCYERFDHGLPHDIIYASDDSDHEDSDDDSDQEELDESTSLNSWQFESDAANLKSLQLPSDHSDAGSLRSWQLESDVANLKSL